MPSRVVSARGALRRSLLIWGWGQHSAGDRRGWLGPPAQATALAGLLLAAPHASGRDAPLVYLALAAVGAAWAAVAVHAWQRAARRRAALGSGPGGGAADLLWLAPVAVLLGSGFWLAVGPAADPALTLDAYLADWRAGRVEAAAARFVSPPSPDLLRTRWEQQDVALRNAVVRIVAAEPEALVDPARPIDGLRWVDLGGTPGDAGPGGGAGGGSSGSDRGRMFAAEIVREDVQRGLLFGILPTTSRRLVTIERLGSVELRPVRDGDAWPFGGPRVWRIVRVAIAGEGLAAAVPHVQRR